VIDGLAFKSLIDLGCVNWHKIVNQTHECVLEYNNVKAVVGLIKRKTFVTNAPLEIIFFCKP